MLSAPFPEIGEAEWAVVTSMNTAASVKTEVNWPIEASGQCDACSPVLRSIVAEPAELQEASPDEGNPDDGNDFKRSGSLSTYLPGYTKSGKRRRRHPVAEVKGGWSAEEDARLQQ